MMSLFNTKTGSESLRSASFAKAIGPAGGDNDIHEEIASVGTVSKDLETPPPN